MLKMKKACEKCKTSTGKDETAYICSYECTFCGNCADKMEYTCPNCAGELLARPTRLNSVATVVTSQIKSRLFS